MSCSPKMNVESCQFSLKNAFWNFLPKRGKKSSRNVDIQQAMDNFTWIFDPHFETKYLSVKGHCGSSVSQFWRQSIVHTELPVGSEVWECGLWRGRVSFQLEFSPHTNDPPHLNKQTNTKTSELMFHFTRLSFLLSNIEIRACDF